MEWMSLRRVLLAFVFTEISNQQLHAFICRDVCNIRMTHITRLGRIEIMKTFKSIMNRMILRYVALLLAICRGGYSAVIFHCFIGNNMDQQSKYQKYSSFMVYIRSYLVKRCNKKNDLRSFWRITQRKFIFLQIVYNTLIWNTHFAL